MKNKIRPLVLFRFIMWISAGFASTFFAFIIVAACSPHIFKDKQAIFIVLFAILTTGFSISFTFAGLAISGQKRFLKSLMIENSYTLGEANQFYNLDAFKIRVDKLSHRLSYKDKKRFVVTFTPTALDISSNRGRDRILTSINLKLAHFLDKTFDKTSDNKLDERSIVYAFSRGTFFFCLFCEDRNFVSEMMNVISNECFRMVNEDKVKIWIQPFFGIKPMEPDESIVSAIEDALIARDHSEKNYESYTYFIESFREGDTSSDVILNALNNNEFVPYYQIKYSLKEKRFVSAEALARWNSPVHGLVGPGKFIDLAERSGLLNAIDLRIFELAVKDLGEALKRGRKVLPVSVNFSLYEFFSRNFLDIIMDTLKKYDVPPQLIEIEITETTSQVNKFLSLSVIKKLKSFGMRVLMDDFGMGYSQIENMREIPFDAIKIDKSFTDKVLTDVKTGSIVKYLVQLAHINNMEAIIEGVENKEQVDFLKKANIDTIQGFYYSKPLPIEEYSELLKNETSKKGAKK